MPSGEGTIENELIAEIAVRIPPPVSTFLLTPLQHANDIVEQHRLCRTSTIQLVDAVGFAELRKLRKRLPGIKLVQVIHVTDENSIAEAKAVSSLVDALLLDSGNPSLAVKELGGTGRTHDWGLSRRIRDGVSLPLFLAGGLHGGNVADAIRAVRPYGVDLCSGIRTGGRLDKAKMLRFFDAIRQTETHTGY
jgi:phosphoribosylanthranilate isomerase